MKKALKWIGIVLGTLVGLIIFVAVVLYASTAMRLSKTYNIQPEALTIPTDPAAIARGKRLAAIYCAGCHGDDYSGTAFFTDPALGTINALNLTPGKGGSGSEFNDAKWVLAIRHGINPEGKPLLIMPSKDLYYLNDADLGAIIAFMKGLPPVDKEWNDPALTPLGRILLAVGAFGDVINTETIDHNGPRPVAPAVGVTTAYGDYLVKTFGCATCHGKDLSGGKDPNPAAPPAPNLTPRGELRLWTEEDFITAVRTRVAEFMPWKDMRNMNDDEVKAVWLFLQSLPAK
jgi:mono/diheme cytochrome c family protein